MKTSFKQDLDALQTEIEMKIDHPCKVYTKENEEPWPCDYVARLEIESIDNEKPIWFEDQIMVDIKNLGIDHNCNTWFRLTGNKLEILYFEINLEII